MEKLKPSTRTKNRIEAFLLTFLGAALLFVSFHIYYDMNDDVLIKDILSGVYAGIPDGHNMQLLFPLSFLISLLYRFLPGLPWFGILLEGCLLLSFYLLLLKGFAMLQNHFKRVICAGMLFLLFTGLLLWEMIFVQYTVVCGVLAMTAALWLYLTPSKDSVREFVCDNSVSILLVVLAFNLRSEMLLLMSPFLAIAGMLKWGEESRLFNKQTLCKYGAFLFGIIILMAGSFGADKLAYSSKEWQSFRSFFDARTQLYDYTWYPDYTKNQTFYEENDISPAQFAMIDNYNFGLDSRIDTDMLNTISAYSTKQKQSVSSLEHLKNTLWQYRCQLTYFSKDSGHETRMMPYNLLVISLYVWLIIIAFLIRDASFFWKLPMMWLLRSVSWLYILYGGRVVARLTHPMYLIEIMILLSCVFSLYCNNRESLGKHTKIIGCVFLTLVALQLFISLPSSITAVNTEQTRRIEVNMTDQALKNYCEEHADNFYYIDVYSTVSFSEDLLAVGEKSISNYDILGGWFSKSPLSEKKALAFGIADVKDAFLEQPNVYFVAEADADVSWLTLFYEEQGKKINVILRDTVNAEGENKQQILNVYQLQEEK